MSNEATNPAKLPPIITRRIADLETFKISDKDTNYFAMIADPIRDQVPFSIFLEIFEPGGKTPWHRHGNAHEMFFVLSGEAKSVCNGMEVQVKAGESFIVRPGHEHEVINVGKDKLYQAAEIRSLISVFMIHCCCIWSRLRCVAMTRWLVPCSAMLILKSGCTLTIRCALFAAW
ncbi:MAG: cupin domain-containing protein [Alphaproteobacteria bacterium]